MGGKMADHDGLESLRLTLDEAFLVRKWIPQVASYRRVEHLVAVDTIVAFEDKNLILNYSSSQCHAVVPPSQERRISLRWIK